MSSLSRKEAHEDAEDHEIFDINDFTTASDWERFIVQVEELFNSWKLNSTVLDSQESVETSFENAEWHEKAEIVQYADEISFTLSYYYLSPEPLGATNVKKSSTEASGRNVDQPSQAETNDFESVFIKRPDPVSDTTTPSANMVNLPPKSMADLLNKTNDFAQFSSFGNRPTPSIAYWYGLCKFVVITPTRLQTNIDTESRANLILGAISVAINNTGCQIPVLVQVNANNRDMFVGLCEGSALKTHFQVLQFNYTPPQYSHLSGLLDIFKSKLGSHLANLSLLISVSIQFTYLIFDNTFLNWNQSTITHNTSRRLASSHSEAELVSKDDQDIYPNLDELPFGSVQDCVDSIYLSSVWSNLSEDIIVDSELFSDLNPLHSNDWTLTVNNLSERCEFQLTQMLSKFCDELKRTIGVHQIISTNASETADEELKRMSLQRLTKSRLDHVYSIGSNLVEKASSQMKILNLNDLPLDKDFLDFIMDYLFPDANLNKRPKDKDRNDPIMTNKYQSFMKKLNHMKASSSDNQGLLNRLACCMALVNEIGQTKAIAQLWREFLLELRFRYDSVIFITGVEEKSQPDLGCCLLHQKIQLLNCCIKKRLERQQFETSQEAANDDATDDSEDQFFDCEEEDDQAPQESTKPEGRLKKAGDMTLLNKPNEPMYVPVTQDSTPMTEDMLEQHTSALLNLGSGEDAALMRAKIQSASLLSDMQSFKAANPGCVIEDFVRWYSPRDIVEVEEKVIDPETSEEKMTKKYELSHRMRIQDNTWVEVWKSAVAVPARRQKRLFDDTKEAERVFEWLNSLSIGQIAEHLLPVLFYSAVHSCYTEAAKYDLIAFVSPILDSLIEKLVKLSRNNEFRKLQELISHVKSIEQVVSLAKSLSVKFKLDQIKSNSKLEIEMSQVLKNIIKLSMGHDSCVVKIENGAHSLVGKLIAKLCSRVEKRSTSSRKSHQSHNKYKLVASSGSFDDSIPDEQQSLQIENFMIEPVTQEGDDNDDEEANNENSHAFLPFEGENPFKREYILRASASRPAPYSRQSPQRMYCAINNLEFRLAGAFTEDTMFF